jgi:hypothetical protein
MSPGYQVIGISSSLLPSFFVENITNQIFLLTFSRRAGNFVHGLWQDNKEDGRGQRRFAERDCRALRSEATDRQLLGVPIIPAT